jgi:glutathione S-transferase
MTLYDNPFSPFARKVRLVLAYKGLAVSTIDALALAHHDGLCAVNARAEVPVLVDGAVTVVNSADIVAYLDHRYPEPPVLPADPAARVTARAWERLADGVLDAILHDISIWTWPTHRRDDQPPPGLLEAGFRDIRAILDQLEAALRGREYLCGALSIADLALFPHVSSLKPLGLALDETHPQVSAWNRRLRGLAVVQQDLEYVRRAAREKFVDGPSPYEGERIIWRGDRIEWLFHNGLVDWWYAEYRAGRAIVPAPFPRAG